MSQLINNIGFGAQGQVRKSRNYRNEGFEGSHISKSKRYKLKLKQNNTTELLSICFPYIYRKKKPQILEKVKMQGFPSLKAP